MTGSAARIASKVPEVTLVFWIIKIAATTLGETGGDTVTMTLNWGYLLGTALFLTLLVALVLCQIAAKKFHPFLYWATIVASTTAGTTLADFADRSLGIGYAGGRHCCSPASSPHSARGTGRKARYRSPPSPRRRWKRSTGSPSPTAKTNGTKPPLPPAVPSQDATWSQLKKS